MQILADPRMTIAHNQHAIQPKVVSALFNHSGCRSSVMMYGCMRAQRLSRLNFGFSQRTKAVETRERYQRAA